MIILKLYYYIQQRKTEKNTRHKCNNSYLVIKWKENRGIYYKHPYPPPKKHSRREYYVDDKMLSKFTFNISYLTIKYSIPMLNRNYGNRNYNN